MPRVIVICTEPEAVQIRLDEYLRRKRRPLSMGNPIDFALMCGWHELNQLFYRTQEKIRLIEGEKSDAAS